MFPKKLEPTARAIKQVGRESKDTNYQLGIRNVAHALADDLCTGSERLHFLLACGVSFDR